MIEDPLPEKMPCPICGADLLLREDTILDAEGFPMRGCAGRQMTGSDGSTVLEQHIFQVVLEDTDVGSWLDSMGFGATGRFYLYHIGTYDKLTKDYVDVKKQTKHGLGIKYPKKIGEMYGHHAFHPKLSREPIERGGMSPDEDPTKYL